MEQYRTVSNTDTDQQVAANVRAELARAGISQSTIADSLGITKSGVSRRMQGRISFRVSELCAIADLIGIPVHVLLAKDNAAA